MNKQTVTTGRCATGRSNKADVYRTTRILLFLIQKNRLGSSFQGIGHQGKKASSPCDTQQGVRALQWSLLTVRRVSGPQHKEGELRQRPGLPKLRRAKRLEFSANRTREEKSPQRASKRELQRLWDSGRINTGVSCSCIQKEMDLTPKFRTGSKSFSTVSQSQRPHSCQDIVEGPQEGNRDHPRSVWMVS